MSDATIGVVIFNESLRIDDHSELEVPEGSLTPLWISNYYDGPLRGLCTLAPHGLLLFTLAEQNDDDHPKWWRKFWLLKLPPEVLALEQTRREDFRRWVSTHWDGAYGWCGGEGAMRPAHLHHRFYDKHGNSSVDLTNAEVIGWFAL